MSSGPTGRDKEQGDTEQGGRLKSGVSLTLALPVHKCCSGDGQSLCKPEQPQGSLAPAPGSLQLLGSCSTRVSQAPCPCVTCQFLSQFKANKCLCELHGFFRGWVIMVQCIFEMQNAFKMFSSLTWLLQAVRSCGMGWRVCLRVPRLGGHIVYHRLRFGWRQSWRLCKAAWL